jgi:hypothetical protein
MFRHLVIFANRTSIAVLMATTPSVAAATWWSIVQNNATYVCTVVRDHPGWMGGVQVGHFPSFQQAVDALLPMKRNGVCK